jgi:methyl-accepting chemotaxis protein
MSGNASREISAFLEEGTKKVHAIVEETKKKVSTLSTTSEEKIHVGVQLAKECSHMLGEMVVKIDEVNRLANEISTANLEQTRGIQEINTAVQQLEEVTQFNNTICQNTRTAFENLNQQMSQLSYVMKDLDGVLRGKTAQGSFNLAKLESSNTAFGKTAPAAPSLQNNPSISFKKTG